MNLALTMPATSSPPASTSGTHGSARRDSDSDAASAHGFDSVLASHAAPERSSRDGSKPVAVTPLPTPRRPAATNATNHPAKATPAASKHAQAEAAVQDEAAPLAKGGQGTPSAADQVDPTTADASTAATPESPPGVPNGSGVVAPVLFLTLAPTKPGAPAPAPTTVPAVGSNTAEARPTPGRIAPRNAATPPTGLPVSVVSVVTGPAGAPAGSSAALAALSPTPVPTSAGVPAAGPATGSAAAVTTGQAKPAPAQTGPTSGGTPSPGQPVDNAKAATSTPPGTNASGAAVASGSQPATALAAATAATAATAAALAAGHTKPPRAPTGPKGTATPSAGQPGEVTTGAPAASGSDPTTPAKPSLTPGTQPAAIVGAGNPIPAPGETGPEATKTGKASAGQPVGIAPTATSTPTATDVPPDAGATTGSDLLVSLLPSPVPAASSSTVAAAPPPGQSAPPPAVHEQVFTALSPLVRGADGSYGVQLHLHPADLGAVQVNVDVRHGEISVQLHATNEAAREALRGGLSDLRQELEAQGLRAGSMEVGSGGANPQQREMSWSKPQPAEAALRRSPVPSDQLVSPAAAVSSAVLDLRM